MAVREKLGELLIQAGILDEASLQRALQEQQRWGGQLGRYLVEMGMIDEETLVRALSTQYKIPAVAIDPARLNVTVGRLIPREICERNSLICFRADLQKRFLDVAISDPSNIDGLEEGRVATQCNLRPHIAAPTVIDKAISFVFYGDMALGGGELDLSPDSPLRDEPRTSELIRGSRPPSRQSPSLGAGRQPGAPLPKMAPMELRISATEVPLPPPRTGAPPAPPPVKTGAPNETLQSLRPIQDDAFHITLDVPQVQQDLAHSQSQLEERVAFLEAVHARDAAILEGLLQAIVKRGLLTREEVLRIIMNK